MDAIKAWWGRRVDAIKAWWSGGGTLASAAGAAAGHLSTILPLVLGLLLGWLMNPILWLIASPPRWIAMVLARAAQESGYSASVGGDGGASVGILQFNVANIGVYGDEDASPDWRTSPYASGRAAADYVADALTTSWRWWILRVPVLGPVALGHLWTHGLSGYGSLDEAGAEAAAEGRYGGAMRFWAAVIVAPWLLFVAVVAFAAAWRRRRRK